jgi:hypothetical protein
MPKNLQSNIYYLLGRIQGTLRLNELKVMDDKKAIEDITLAIKIYDKAVKDEDNIKGEEK